MPIEPTEVRVERISISSANTWPPGGRHSTGNFVRAIRVSGCPRPSEDQADQGRRERGVLRTRATENAEMRRSSGGLDDLVDRALQEEGVLGNLVVLAFHDLLEAADRLGDRHVGAGGTGELFGDKERLGEEALDLAGPLHGELVLVGELVDTEDRDDVLELLVEIGRAHV